MASTSTLAVLARVLASRDLRRVLLSYFAFHIAEFGTWVAILLYAYEATGPASVGVIALIQLVPAALAAAPAATLGDRYPRHRVLTVGYLVQAAAMLATAGAMFAAMPIPVVYLAATLAATALVVTRPTQSALLPSLSRTPDELTAANGAAGIVEGLGVLLGPLVAAAVLTGASVGMVFLVAGGALIGAALATAGLRPRIARRSTGAGGEGRTFPGSTDPSFLAGVRAVAEDPDARLIVGLLTARMVIAGAADVLYVLLALDLLGMGEPGAGVLNAALGGGTVLGGALGFALIGRERLAMVTAVGAVTWGIAIAVIGLSGAAALAPGLFVLGGAGLTILEISGRTILQRSVRDEVLSRVFGVQEGLAMAGLALGSIAVSILVGATGLVATVLIVGAFLPVVVLVAWSRLAALDRRATPPIQALELLRRTALFRPLPPPQLEAVARHGTWLTVGAGTVLMREGDPGDRYYVLSAGALRVTRAGAVLRDMDEPGSGVGEIALLLDVPRTATVTTTEGSVLFAIDREPFLAAVTGHPGTLAAARAEVALRAS